MNIGVNIKNRREIRNFSQAFLAKEIGISQKQLSRIENNEVSPSVALLTKMAQKLDASLPELLFFTENYIFNKGSENETTAHRSNEIKQVENLYQKLLAEKERIIQILLDQQEKSVQTTLTQTVEKSRFYLNNAVEKVLHYSS